MGETFIEPASTMQDLFRTMFAFFDRGVYWLLTIVYQLFFNVASADLFANETIVNFYGRVQLIIGVFMMFQLAMTILKGIINPDTFTDSKNGASNVITRIITALVLLAVLVPVNFGSPRNEYEIQINNNGLLFGTLYSLQHRILSNNTIGRLILGSDADKMDYVSDTSNDGELQKSSRIFTATILKGFYRINLLPEDQRPKHEDGKDDAIFNDNRVCKDIDDELLAAYTRVDAEPGEILSMVTLTCNSDGTETFIERIANRFTSRFSGKDRYILAYIPPWSTVVGLVFVFVLLSFTIDISVRAIKLAVLRLIAPIPIISYMDPKGSKDSAFNAWVKAVTSTYLDLFIRLATVYFVIFIIQDICINGLPVFRNVSGIMGTMTAILIILGLLIFAKQAPKFIKESIGLKADAGGKLFGGLGEVLGAASIGLGAAGSFNAARKASVMADQVNHNTPEGFGGKLLNHGKHLLSGVAGGVGGIATGFNAWANAKDHSGKAVMDAIEKRNATAISRGASGSTFLGRMNANAHRLIQGDGATTFDRDTREIAQKKGIEKASKDLFSYLEGKGKTDGADYKITTSGIDALGGASVHGTLNEFNRLKARALSEEQRTGVAADFVFDGHTINAHDAVAQKIEEELSYAAGDEWAYRQEMGAVNADRLKAEMDTIFAAHPEYNRNSDDDTATVTSMAKDAIRAAYETEIRGANPTYTDEQVAEEVKRRTTTFGEDAGYKQKKDTYNESIYLSSDPNNTKLYKEYKASEDPNGNITGVTFYASKLKKTSKAAGGEAARLENSDSYKRQKADYNATDKK